LVATVISPVTGFIAVSRMQQADPKDRVSTIVPVAVTISLTSIDPV